MIVIEGNLHRDERGIVRFVNDFDMTHVKRMYCIEPKLGVVRAWQGHKIETKWFYAAKGSFLVKTVNMFNFEKKEYYLKDKDSNILEIKGGCYNGFESLEVGGVLMVFSNFDLVGSKADDWRESIETIAW